MTTPKPFYVAHYFAGDAMHELEVTESHYRAAVAYLERHHIDTTVENIEEILVNFDELELHPDQDLKD